MKQSASLIFILERKHCAAINSLGKPAVGGSDRTEVWIYIKRLESEVKSSHQMVVKTVWPNYIYFFRLIFKVQVETFEDFGSSGFTECTSIADSQNSFPVHHTSRFTDPKNGWSRRHDNKLCSRPPPLPPLDLGLRDQGEYWQGRSMWFMNRYTCNQKSGTCAHTTAISRPSHF